MSVQVDPRNNKSIVSGLMNSKKCPIALCYLSYSVDILAVTHRMTSPHLPCIDTLTQVVDICT